MKIKIAFLAVLFIGIGHFAQAATPVSLIGSNPYFSSQLSPQDLLLRQGNYLYYYPQYQSAPWWGDISEPANKPTTGDYTVTGVDIIDGKASFKHFGSMQTINNNLGYACLLGNKLMANFEVKYSIDALRNTASGNMIGTSDSAYTFKAGGTLPFEYSNRHTLNRFSVQGMVGSMYQDFPIGIKFSGGFENTISLKRDLSFSKLKEIDSAVFAPDSMISYHYTDDQARVLWGWNTSPCNHIFGVKGPQGDSWLKYDYAIGPLYHFELLGGITLPKVKAGLYYRFKQGHQDQYYWESNARDSTVIDNVIWDNFNGAYQKQNFSRVKGAWELRTFGNFNQRSGERYALNTFVSLGYIDSTTKSALSNNLDMEQYNKPADAIRTIALELEPNINIKFGEFLNFFDAALLFDYRYTRFSNTFETDVAGGRGRVFQTSTVYMGDDYSGADFSYANQNSLHFGADFSTMFPVYSAFPHHLSLGLMLVGNLKYTLQTKYYGTSNNGVFTLDNRRTNYQREVWFNSFLMLHYVQGPYQLRFEVTEPILYSLLPSTKVTDAQGNGILYEHEKSPLWVSQLGMRAGIYASYDIVLPFVRGLQKGKY
jgi:hypothetical protein